MLYLELMDHINDKRRKFAELGTNRVNKAINDIRLIGNLSNKANYDYNDADVRQIMKALRDAVNEAESRFKKSQRKSEGNGFQINP
jgi:transcription elongation GreA/GreB family factor